VILQRVHLAVAVVFVVAIVVQVFLAGTALVNLGGSGNFTEHIEFGYTWLGLVALVLLVTAFVARRPRGDVAVVASMVLLYIVQTILPAARTSSTTWIAALHPVIALFLFALAAWYAQRVWRATMS
jgi:uncharacterized membrane protein YkvI